jgi:phosphoribosylcarboxyaminoimidazole (NCAIR) mutase
MNESALHWRWLNAFADERQAEDVNTVAGGGKAAHLPNP